MKQRWYFLLAASLILGTSSLNSGAARAQTSPPPETHNNDLLMGGNQSFGASGTGSAFWFSDSAANPGRLASWLADAHLMIPDVTGPSTMGHLYFNLGTDVVKVTSGSPPVARAVLGGAKLQATFVTPGLIVEKFGAAAFSANSAETQLGNVFSYPFSGSFHQHYNCRAFRPGTYTFRFKLTSVTARDGSSLADSPEYTLTLQSRAVLGGRITLPSWQGVDTTPYKSGNIARVFVFPAGSTPSAESDAIGYTDVYLDANGNWQMPEAVRKTNSTDVIPDGSYRIGVKPLTASALARLYPGNVTLSATAPITLPPIACPLGDLNRDGIVDEFDYNTVVQNFYTSGADVDGDGFMDEFDYNLIVQNFYNTSDFTP